MDIIIKPWAKERIKNIAPDLMHGIRGYTKGLKMCKIKMVVLIFFCTALTGCGTKAWNRDSMQSEYSTELETVKDIDKTNQNLEEQGTSGELVSAAEFMEYYQMQDNDVPTDYLAAFIKHRQLTRDSLGERMYDEMVKKLYERGVVFGSTIADLISGKAVSISQEDDFTDIAYIVMNKELYIDATDVSVPQNAVLEVDNRKVYLSQGSVTDDYTAGNVRDISEQDVEKCLQKLHSIITEDWKSSYLVEGKTYEWKLYIVKKDSSVISYQGEGIDEEHHPGLEQWYRDFFE